MKLERLSEPKLRFKDNADTYCKFGLGECGPYDAAKESHKEVISKVEKTADLGVKSGIPS
jgi:hypothetical protein